MQLLGIDYGKVYVGLALASADFPSPLKVIQSKSDSHKIDEIKKICLQEKIDKIIIGKGSGQLENHIRGFVKKLQKEINTEIILIDETFTSNRALEEMLSLDISKNKRRELEHAYAAVLLIKSYLNQ